MKTEIIRLQGVSKYGQIETQQDGTFYASAWIDLQNGRGAKIKTRMSGFNARFFKTNAGATKAILNYLSAQ